MTTRWLCVCSFDVITHLPNTKLCVQNTHAGAGFFFFFSSMLQWTRRTKKLKNICPLSTVSECVCVCAFYYPGSHMYCNNTFLWAGQKYVGFLPHYSSFSYDPSGFSLESLTRSFISHKKEKDWFTEVIILTRNNLLYSHRKHF